MKKIFFIALLCFAAVACNPGEENTNSWSRDFENNMVTVNTESNAEYTDNATVIVEMKDITKPYVNLRIEGIKFVAMMPDVNFALSDVPFTLYASDDTNDPLYGSWTFNEKALVPTVGGVAREEYTMYNFKGNLSDFGLFLSFDVNVGGTIYHATFGENNAVQTWTASFQAKATVVIKEGDNSTTSEDSFDLSFLQENLSKQIVDISLSGLRFTPQMPEVSIVLKAVPFSYSEDGSQRLFNVATLVPLVDNEPLQEFTLTNFTGTLSKSEVIIDCDIVSAGAHASISGTSK